MANISTTQQAFPLSPQPITKTANANVTNKESLLLKENITTEEDRVNLDKLFTKINYNNEMIKLYEIDKLNSKDINHKELIDKKINNLINE